LGHFHQSLGSRPSGSRRGIQEVPQTLHFNAGCSSFTSSTPTFASEGSINRKLNEISSGRTQARSEIFSRGGLSLFSY
jgi:hypothetical protein